MEGVRHEPAGKRTAALESRPAPPAHTSRSHAVRVQSKTTAVALAVKRVLDVVVAGGFLLALSPLMAVIAVAIKWEDGGPILFVQDRRGLGRRPFRCLKFRTMLVGAEKQGTHVRADDRRITRIGSIIRRWTFDEIPQLWNVLRGEMSIVGPRPWVPEEAAYCKGSDLRRFSVRPGMAGWAWIHGRNEVPWEKRIELDLWYVDHWSLSLDAYILYQAFIVALRRKGVYGAETGDGRRGTGERQA